jgi:hypothetical protein
MPAPTRPTAAELRDVVDRELALLAPEVQRDALRTRYLGADAVLVTSRWRESGREALRNSVWLRDVAAGWLLLFQQGTVCAAR